MALTCTACAPLVRPAPFAGASDQVAEVSLTGPFDGQIVDFNTREPIAGATVVAVWSFEAGEGFTRPAGSEVLEVTSDRSGRYRIPRVSLANRSPKERLVRFTLQVYKRGFIAYRSDLEEDGQPRHDFVQRHNDVSLTKWRTEDSHARHLAYLAPTRLVAQRSDWESDIANLDLYRELLDPSSASTTTRRSKVGVTNSSQNTVADPDNATALATSASGPLNAFALLTVEELAERTGSFDAFEVNELQDIPRSATYHGVHLQANGEDPTHDLAFRVWNHPDDGLNSVRDLLNQNMPGANKSDAVTAETYLLETPEARAVAYIDEDLDSAVLLTCGIELCIDNATVFILGKLIHSRLDKITHDALAPTETAEGN